MVLISVLFVSLAAIVKAASVASYEPGEPAHHQLEERQSQSGFRFYFQNWSDGVAKVNCRSGSDGAYNASWSGNKGNFVCGKGYFDVGTRYCSILHPVAELPREDSLTRSHRSGTSATRAPSRARATPMSRSTGGRAIRWWSGTLSSGTARTSPARATTRRSSGWAT